VFHTGSGGRLTVTLQRGHCRPQPSLATVQVMHWGPLGHILFSAQGGSGGPIRTRELPSRERMEREGRGQSGHSTPHHAKLALNSCAAHRATTPKQQFYIKGEDSQGAWTDMYCQVFHL